MIAPPTVLVIGDDVDAHQLLEVRLRPDNLVLLYERDTDAGVRRARALAPDLILVGAGVAPSAVAVCRRLKQHAETAAIPVLMLAAAGGVDRAALFDAGAADYVAHPFEASELRARVRAALRSRRYEELLASRAEVDALTGLWNRAHFDRRLADELRAAVTRGRPVSLVLLDLDDFTRCNDELGRPFGDRVLQLVGETLRASIRDIDAACRYGGAEMALILTETPCIDAAVTAEKARAAIARMAFRERGRNVVVTASFGVAGSAELPEPVRTVDALIVACDAALHRAKHRGKNRVERAGQPTRQIPILRAAP